MADPTTTRGKRVLVMNLRTMVSPSETKRIEERDRKQGRTIVRIKRTFNVAPPEGEVEPIAKRRRPPRKAEREMGRPSQGPGIPQ